MTRASDPHRPRVTDWAGAAQRINGVPRAVCR